MGAKARVAETGSFGHNAAWGYIGPMKNSARDARANCGGFATTIVRPLELCRPAAQPLPGPCLAPAWPLPGPCLALPLPWPHCTSGVTSWRSTAA